MKLNDRQLDWDFAGGGISLEIENHAGGSKSFRFVKTDIVEQPKKDVKASFAENLVQGLLKSGGKNWYAHMNEQFDEFFSSVETVRNSSHQYK